MTGSPKALRHIKDVGIHKETIYTCYVLENRRLIGIVTAKELMTSEDEIRIEDLMETEMISVNTHRQGGGCPAFLQV